MYPKAYLVGTVVVGSIINMSPYYSCTSYTKYSFDDLIEEMVREDREQINLVLNNNGDYSKIAKFLQ